MRPRFQADANLRQAIVDGCLRREPAIDFRTAIAAGLEGKPDVEVLRVAASDSRILVSHDIRTMPGHFAAYIAAGQASAGLLLLPQRVPVALAIEDLLLIWLVSDAADWRNRIAWLPL